MSDLMQLAERLVAALEQIAENGKSNEVQLPPPPAEQSAPKEEAPPKPAEKPKRRGRKPKAEKVETPVTETQNEEPPFDYDVLKKEILAVAALGGEAKAKVLELNASYGAKKASDVDPSKWPDLLEDVKTLRAELEAGSDDDFA